MSLKYIQKMPTLEELEVMLPFTEDLRKIKSERDEQIKDIFHGEDSRILMVIGPCSADNEDAVVDYVCRLAEVQEKVKDKIFIIPRIYTNKPRTTGLGYKGMMHQPNPHAKPNVVEGIKAIRSMHLRALRESGLSSADEMLYPDNGNYLEGILSYVAVGARSTENQKHRLTASGLDIPVGMKNPTSGDIEVMLNSITAGQNSHIVTYGNWEVQTSGNELAHAVLRGATDQNGCNIPNYHYEDLLHVTEHYIERNLKNPTIIIDSNHANSDKKFLEQPRIINEVMQSRKINSSVKKVVKGFMVESYIKDGKQGIDGQEYGKSITDPCIGWDVTERMLLDLADKID